VKLVIAIHKGCKQGKHNYSFTKKADRSVATNTKPYGRIQAIKKSLNSQQYVQTKQKTKFLIKNHNIQRRTAFLRLRSPLVRLHLAPILVWDINHRHQLTLINIFSVVELPFIYWNLIKLSGLPNSSGKPKIVLLDHKTFKFAKFFLGIGLVWLLLFLI